MDSTEITVYPAPVVDAISAAYTAVCAGNTVDLSDTGGIWGSLNTAIATVTGAGAVTGSGAGTDTVFYTTTNSYGCSGSAMISLVIGGAMPAASVIPDATTYVCRGHTAYMQVTASAGITYQWLRNGIAVPGATTFGYTTGATGNYSVILSNGTCSETITGPAVILSPAPVISFISPNLLYTGTFSSYEWFKNGVLVTGATGNILNETGNGVYTVVVTGPGGCSDTSAGYTFGGATGVNGVTNSQDIKIYPNPATSMVHIDAPVKVNISVVGIDGKLLIEQKDATDIDITGLADGMYLVMVYDENGLLVKTAKFAKQNKQ